MKIRSLLLAISILPCLTNNAFAKVVNTNQFSIHLPEEMKLSWQNKSRSIPLNQYVYTDSHKQQIRITIVGDRKIKSPVQKDGVINVLGSNIAMYAQANHIDLSKHVKDLNRKPGSLSLGKYIYKTAQLNTHKSKALFLVRVDKHRVYNVSLSSHATSHKSAHKNMQALLNTLKTINYHY